MAGPAVGICLDRRQPRQDPVEGGEQKRFRRTRTERLRPRVRDSEKSPAHAATEVAESFLSPRREEFAKARSDAKVAKRINHEEPSFARFADLRAFANSSSSNAKKSDTPLAASTVPSQALFTCQRATSLSLRERAGVRANRPTTTRPRLPIKFKTPHLLSKPRHPSHHTPPSP